MSGYTYDTGALLAAERRRERMWALHEDALLRGIRPVVPATVLAQAWRGGPQPELSRLLRGCRTEPLDEARARAAGTACAAGTTSDIVDASVAVGAISRHDVCVTSDPADLSALATALGHRLPTLAI